MAAEVADGWLPIFFVPDKAKEVFGPSLEAGDGQARPVARPAADRRRRPARHRRGVRGRPHPRPGPGAAALYIGGMGAKGKNFYNALACRYGYEKEAAEIQDLYLSGKKEEAAALVPAELLEATSLCGPESYIKERVAALAEVGVTHLNVTPVGPDPVAMIEKLRSWV